MRHLFPVILCGVGSDNTAFPEYGMTGGIHIAKHINFSILTLPGSGLQQYTSCHLHAVGKHGAASVHEISGELRYTEICHVTYLLYGHMVQSRYRGHLGDVVTLRYVMSLTCCSTTWCSFGTEVIWGTSLH